MNEVNKTLYIPLYGKAFVSKKGLFLKDEAAEKIWDKEGFALKGKAKSKYLAYYMGIRALVFDNWVKQKIAESKDTAIIHIGSGLDSRVLRINASNHMWYDVDFPQVIEERKKHYSENASYKMIGADVRANWLTRVNESKNAIVIMEGVSMYLTPQELINLTQSFSEHFEHVSILMDCYSNFAAKMSKYKNPVNNVGVTRLYGIDSPKQLETGQLNFVKEHTMIPQEYIGALKGFEKHIFAKLYAGSISKKLYRLFEYEK
jgi:O-methyltransferase involved in polyketide biosynthesis